MTSSRQALGKWGETFAANYLTQQGYTIIGQNFRTPFGEIDLIVQKDDFLVFVEVKTRSSDAYGLPEEAITATKREHLISAAQAYLQEVPAPALDWRIDVIAIRKNKTNPKPEVVHFENAIT